MSTKTIPVRIDEEITSALVLKGDLSGLTGPQRVAYYKAFCDHLGLNPVTQPFSILSLGGKQILYATKMATDQLRTLKGVSITDIKGEMIGDCYRVTAIGHDKTGRTDAATGVVAIGNKHGDDLANATMKAETKAKRRLTLSLCGLGMLDESEIETIPHADTRVLLPEEAKTEQIYDVGKSTSTELPKKSADESERSFLRGQYMKLHKSKWLTVDDKAAMKEKMQDANKQLPAIKAVIASFRAIADAMAKSAGDESYKAWSAELDASIVTGEVEL